MREKNKSQAQKDYDSGVRGRNRPNAYYNYRKAGYYAPKAEIQEQLHSHNGMDDYRSISAYLKRVGHSYSATTIHKYMNTQMGLRFIVHQTYTFEYHQPTFLAYILCFISLIHFLSRSRYYNWI